MRKIFQTKDQKDFKHLRLISRGILTPGKKNIYLHNNIHNIVEIIPYCVEQRIQIRDFYSACTGKLLFIQTATLSRVEKEIQ